MDGQERSAQSNDTAAAAPFPAPEATRVILSDVERNRAPDGNVQIRCTLKLRGDEHDGTASSESGEPMEMRAAAAATLQALDRALGGGVGLRLVGIKQIRAFDSDLVIVSIWTSESPARHLIGAVPVTAGPIRAACTAVLDASNRFLAQVITAGD